MFLKRAYTVLLDEDLIKAIQTHCKPIGLKQTAFVQNCIGKELGWQKREQPTT